MRKILTILLMFSIVLLSACGQKTESAELGEKIEVVAKVGEQVIILEDFNKSFLIIEKKYKEDYGPDIMSQLVGERTLLELVQEQVLNNMVLEEVIKQNLIQENINIDQAEIDENYKRFYEQELKDNSEKQAFFKANGIDETFIKEQLENQLYSRELNNQITEQVNERAVSDEDVFKLNVVKVKARHILVKEKALAEEILVKLQAGEDFATLANTYTIDPGSKNNGGDLDYFGRNAMVKPFEDAAFALKEGQISGLVETQFGFHIIKVEDVKTLKDLELEGASVDELKIQKEAVLRALVDTEMYKVIDQIKTKVIIETYPEVIRK